jgi:type II secretory pathway component GspD/PulD (secretin)
VGDIFTGVINIFNQLGADLGKEVRDAFALKALDSASSALDSLGAQNSGNMTYYDAPMEQPFFHVRSIDSKVSVYPGATIVMGGLITEQRKAMDDKVPFLGDIPFIGRLFRSHSEFSSKRNLLIFVTTRLVDAHGREVKIAANGAEKASADVKPAPEK